MPARSTPGCLGQILGLLAVVIGVAVVVLTVSIPLRGQAQSFPAPARWSEGPLHLQTESRTLQTCLVTPDGGTPERIVVPYADFESWAGVTVVPAPGTSTVLACSEDVSASAGPLLALYPLAENEPWVILPAATLAAIGWVYGRPFRRSARPV